jgi:hypothetical protein
MVTLPNVLEILGSRFKEKIKSSNNLNSTKNVFLSISMMKKVLVVAW